MKRSQTLVAPSARARTSAIRRPQLDDPVNFLLATRDTGYRSTAQAIAEFIDNSLQAAATRVAVTVKQGTDPDYPLEITITDNGSGMNAAVLSHALTFGGSSRFDDRSSLGRYGMGLPNGALSRARRVEVYSWQGREVLWSRLDIDELAATRHRALVPVEAAQQLPFSPSSLTGTVVRLLRCDRLEYKRASWFARNLEAELGRIYRIFLGKGLKLSVNGRAVTSIDPMFLQSSSRVRGAQQFGDVLRYRLPANRGEGEIRVRLSELPIDKWHKLSSDEKRELDITNASSVSVLRADREIDGGWFFMGGKRRENYDDWWRCEVRFDPAKKIGG